ncbi:MAG: citrate:proton symporter [Propionivibrio sp.]
MLAFLGFAMVATLVYFLLSEKASPVPTFIILPVIAGSLALYVKMGGDPAIQFMPEMIKYLKAGLGTTMPIAVMFIFSILYFTIMSDAGLFDPLVDWLSKKAGHNVVMVTVSTCLIAVVSHMDGALASTLLVTVPAMLPVYKRLNMRPVVLLAIIGGAMSIMNLLPWGGPTARSAAILKMDVNELWIPLIPVQIVGLVIAIGFAVYLGLGEKKRGAGLPAEGHRPTGEAAKEAKEEEKMAKYRRPKLFWFNLLLTIGVIAMLTAFSKLPAYAPFMLGTAIMMVVNYNAKEQSDLIKKHAASALSVPAILLASGVFLGILSGTGMLPAMANALIEVIPAALGKYLHFIMGALAVPVGMLLGTDSFFFGLVPLAIDVGSKYGIDPRNMVNAMLIGKNYGVLVTPHAATTFLAVGLAGISLKELLTFCVPRLWILSLLAMAAAVVTGQIWFS